MKQLPGEILDHFKKGLQGDAVLQGDAEYDACRQIWNAMIDRKPALIVRCKSEADVAQAIRFARDNDLLVAIKSGGHNIAGNALCDDGLVIDFTLMKNIIVDPDKRTALVESGCTLADFDAAVQAHGLATPVGINSTTGIAGLTLGGGFGWLSRKYGLTVDNLISAEVVLADGRLVRASEKENPDLFWALRGGGGNFGVVVRFEFQLHPVGPEIFTGLMIYDFKDAKQVLQRFADFTRTMPDELTVYAVIRLAPPLPFLPQECHGKEVVVLAIFYTGDPVEGEEAIKPMRDFGKVLGEATAVQPYAAWNQAFDPMLGPGYRNYWKTHNFSRISDEVIDAIIEFIGKLPVPETDILIAGLGGRISRVAPDAMAYSARDINYIMNIHGRWETNKQDEGVMSWARGLWDKVKPYSTGGAFMNFLTLDEAGRVSSAYGPTYQKLREIKRKYDPTNFFRVNQNIEPAG